MSGWDSYIREALLGQGGSPEVSVVEKCEKFPQRWNFFGGQNVFILMGRQNRQHYPGAVYHVMSRGNAGQLIYRDFEDFAVFLTVAADVFIRTGCRGLAYCLMSNHYHFLIEVLGLPLESIMRRILTRFSNWSNRKYGRFGHIFQARYQAKICSTDRYYQTLLPYVHRNPVAAGMVEHAEDWQWSSARQFSGPIHSTLIDPDRALSFLSPDPKEARAIYTEIMAHPGENFVPDFDMRPLMQWRMNPNAPTMLSLNQLAEEIHRELGIEVAGIIGENRTLDLSRARRRFVKKAAAAGHGTNAIARFLGIDRSAVSHALRHDP